MKTCRIVMPARGSARWILEAIASVRDARVREGWSYELAVGVDACRETACLLLAEGERFWYSGTHVGPALIRNSLCVLGNPPDAFAFFDADDVMLRNYLHDALEYIEKGYDIVGLDRLHMDEVGRLQAEPQIAWGDGVATWTREALYGMGGFRDWPVHSDTDALNRARARRLRVTRCPRIGFWRRLHPASLTMMKGTELFGPFREEYRRRSQRDIHKGDLIAPFTFTRLLPETRAEKHVL